jgi:DNA polymerase-4
VKAASRLRRYNLFASALALSIRTIEGDRWSRALSFNEADDNFSFLKALEDLWDLMCAEHSTMFRVKKVSVTIFNLTEEKDITLDLFSVQQDKKSIKNQDLSKAMDNINKRYGKSSVQVGLTGKGERNIGTKIAFTRIPENDEFLE